MEVCLISKEPIEELIKLPCNHSFEYIYLYYEIIEQKKNNIKGFKCPYCRMCYDNTIPYYELPDVHKNKNVNFRQVKTLRLFDCSLCGEVGHKYTHGIFCIEHSKIKQRCVSICKNGNRCKNNAKIGVNCNKHTPSEKEL